MLPSIQKLHSKYIIVDIMFIPFDKFVKIYLVKKQLTKALFSGPELKSEMSDFIKCLKNFLNCKNLKK